MNNFTKIYVTKKGYKQYIDALNQAQQVLADHVKTRSDYGVNTGDNYRTAAFDEKRLRLAYAVKEMEDTISNLVIIEDKNAKENTINMDDIINIQFKGEESCKVQIVGGMPDVNREDGMICITINSPLGAALYKKKIGDKVSYNVGNKEFQVDILSKEKQEEETLEK